MPLTPPKRLFHVPSMSTVMYRNAIDDVKRKGYAAVSHVWGIQELYTPKELRIISGVDWIVPLSNPNKIRRLVEAMNYYEKEYCWFDVLCMPQNRQDEINSEIPLMGNYYSGAHMTFVLSDENYIISEDYTRWCDMMSDMMKSRREPTLDEHAWMLRERADLLDIYKDKWFTRVWTLQETVLSRKVILISTNKHHINLTNLINRFAYQSLTNSLYDSMTFEKSRKYILGVTSATLKYKSGSLDLVSILVTNKDRNCCKIHDRFYGVLGILDYKDFPVDYNMNIDDVNKAIVQYSHSKGDVSWISIGGNLRKGFVQPMHKDFSNVGSNWKEEISGVCDIVFSDVLSMKALEFATVVSCKKFAESGRNGDDIFSWMIYELKNWGFSTLEILNLIYEYGDTPDDIVVRVATTAFDAIHSGMKLENVVSAMDGTFAEDRGFMPLVDIFRKANSTSKMHETVTIIDVSADIVNKRYPLSVIGDVDVGDKIMVPQIYDNKKRCIGIVTSNSIRKGVCVVPHMKTDDNLKPIRFVHREFVL